MKLFLITISLFFVINVNGQQKLMGFSEANANSQLDWEKQFDALLNAKNLDT